MIGPHLWDFPMSMCARDNTKTDILLQCEYSIFGIGHYHLVDWFPYGSPIDLNRHVVDTSIRHSPPASTILPGRKRASSIISSRFVIPIIRILLSCSTPSIFDNNWLTTESPTPVPSFLDPRCLHMASSSSNMIICSELSSARCLYWTNFGFLC